MLLSEAQVFEKICPPSRKGGAQWRRNRRYIKAPVAPATKLVWLTFIKKTATCNDTSTCSGDYLRRLEVQSSFHEFPSWPLEKDENACMWTRLLLGQNIGLEKTFSWCVLFWHSLLILTNCLSMLVGTKSVWPPLIWIRFFYSKHSKQLQHLRL